MATALPSRRPTEERLYLDRLPTTAAAVGRARLRQLDEDSTDGIIYLKGLPYLAPDYLLSRIRAHEACARRWRHKLPGRDLGADLAEVLFGAYEAHACDAESRAERCRGALAVTLADMRGRP
jgi:hypothetical protein